MPDTDQAGAWGELAPPVDLPPGTTVPPDTEPVTDGPLCPVCNLVIVRDPSWSRMHKYHDECQPATHKKGQAGTGEKRIRTSGKAEAEADRCEQLLRGFFVKLALGVSIVDRYDAFCIMVNAPSVCTNFRGVCLRYPAMRKEFLKVPEGGSVLGLVLSAVAMGAPMAAHHGLIPSQRIAEAMVNLPLTLYRLHKRMTEGQAGLEALMETYMSQMKADREKQQERVAANGSPVPAS